MWSFLQKKSAVILLFQIGKKSFYKWLFHFAKWQKWFHWFGDNRQKIADGNAVQCKACASPNSLLFAYFALLMLTDRLDEEYHKVTKSRKSPSLLFVRSFSAPPLSSSTISFNTTWKQRRKHKYIFCDLCICQECCVAQKSHLCTSC